ncbi:hypothetical protein, partial [Cellulomonas biazotea]|uniref:hypothetical protein n=1 Tax=Cellulomonas biazotea TaxID=1709 RepID=UPI0035EDA022
KKAAVVPPVGTVEDPQDEPALADEALAPIADAEPADDGADPRPTADGEEDRPDVSSADHQGSTSSEEDHR